MISSIDQIVAEVSPLWAPPPRQTVCEWAEEHFIVATGADKGRFKPKTYQVEPINALGDARISSVVIMSATQMLKTITILVGIAYVIARDPDPIMVVLPRDSDVSKFSKFRLAPMLREMPALRGLVSEPKARDSSTTIDTKDFPGGPLILTAAGSPGNLASYAIRYLFCDEVDKYPASSGAEGNPIEVALKRTATFRSRRKLVETCSPTNAGESQIEAAYNDSDQRKFWIPCPHCEREQILHWPQVRFERKIADIKQRAATARYQCEHCGARWNDVERWAAVHRGVWRASKPFHGSAGFWISEIYSPFKTLREIAYGFADAGIAVQAAARTLTTALERLAALAEDSDAITAVGWPYSDLQNGVAKDPVGTLRRVLETLRTIGTDRDSLTVALFGSDRHACKS
jgi:phage terminase large subunit GpA-like protein